MGDTVVVTSTDFNPDTESFKIEALDAETNTLTLNTALQRAHNARTWVDPRGTGEIDMRARVINVASNVVIDADDGPEQWAARETAEGEKFGMHVLVADKGVAHLGHVTLRHCGQYGLGRGCLKFQGRQHSTTADRAAVNAIAGSTVHGCATVNSAILPDYAAVGLPSARVSPRKHADGFLSSM